MSGECSTFYLVDAAVLPEIFSKVVTAKQLIETGACDSVQAAADMAGISRSAFYKYRDAVFKYNEQRADGTTTFAMDLDNTPGLLSDALNIIAACSANILTINQTIPLRGVANVTMTLEYNGRFPEDIFERLKKLPGLHGIKILAQT
ncbi:MAG: ACT domain-containing protein [Clostridiales bacterium]|jgi:chorismate mutase|nr:ACT domain-containing protein [Clostridiales bacterium]